MKRGLIFIIFLLTIFAVSAFKGDISNSKYSSDTFKIKFDDNPDSIIYNRTGFYEYGCNQDGRLFIKFDVDSEIHATDKIELNYKIFGVPGSGRELNGKYYRRNLQTGIFEEISGTKLFSSFEYYFWSDQLFDENDYIIKEKNLDGQNMEKTFYIHCPKFKYSCEDFKPIAVCYNAKNEQLVIEFSGINIDENENFGLGDLFIHTKGTNERSNLLDNTLSKDAVMEKIGSKYKITSSLLYGNPEAGTNIINYVYLQPKACFYDMYPEAYITPKCEGVKEVVSEVIQEQDNEITGAAVSETSTGNNYWVYGFVLLTLIVIIVIVIKRKKSA